DERTRRFLGKRRPSFPWKTTPLSANKHHAHECPPYNRRAAHAPHQIRKNKSRGSRHKNVGLASVHATGDPPPWSTHTTSAFAIARLVCCRQQQRIEAVLTLLSWLLLVHSDPEKAREKTSQPQAQRKWGGRKQTSKTRQE
ncbi:unnamed protein product, partial [Ectocarpus sp. 13 AM-2016]